jgi:hypothetical protein
MARRRKLSADRDADDTPFENVEETEVEETKVEETTDHAVHPLFETVGETASEIDSTMDTHTELPPPLQELEVYRLEHSTKDTHTSVICKLRAHLPDPRASSSDPECFCRNEAGPARGLASRQSSYSPVPQRRRGRA